MCWRPEVAGPRAESVETTVRPAERASTVVGLLDPCGVPIVRSVTCATSIAGVCCGPRSRPWGVA